jgi:hypothetical protein
MMVVTYNLDLGDAWGTWIFRAIRKNIQAKPIGLA